MPACSWCKKPISSTDAKKQKVQKDERGRIKGFLHLKCYFVELKRARFEEQGRTSAPDAYTAKAAHLTADDVTEDAKARAVVAEQRYQALMALKAKPAVAPEDLLAVGATEGSESLDDLLSAAEQDVVLAKRQAELAEDRAQEETPKDRWDDWRLQGGESSDGPGDSL